MYHILSPQTPCGARRLVLPLENSTECHKNQGRLLLPQHIHRKPPTIHVNNQPVPWSQ
ncbi:hypothetical protein TNCV_4483041, partial [Trichonephila clavipes]